MFSGSDDAGGLGARFVIDGAELGDAGFGGIGSEGKGGEEEDEN
jgi:hypothetical protein